MKKMLSEHLATRGLLLILSFVIVFHVLILSGVFPSTIVWGGRITSRTELVRFELVSILLNAVMLTIVAIKANIINLPIQRKILKVGLWFMFALFLLNTIGNLASLNKIEQIVFTPLTLVLSLFTLRLAIAPDSVER